jgi:V8-like Glu-specific endopeptidase
MLSDSTQHAPNSNRSSSILTHSAADPLAIPVSSYSKDLPRSAIGRVFFYDTVKQEDFSCSGTVIASANGSVVDTAGHCVYNNGAWLTNWDFCPQYRNGNSPDGCWPATQLFAAPGWTNNAQRISEFGMAVIQPLNGQTIMSRVGGMPWEANFSPLVLVGLFVTSYGYHANPPYNGEQMYLIVRALTFYTNRDTNNSTDNGTFMKLDNDDMQDGASGGPWFITYQGRQFLIGHSSFRLDGVLADHSPYLNNEWLDLLNIVQNAPNSAP